MTSKFEDLPEIVLKQIPLQIAIIIENQTLFLSSWFYGYWVHVYFESIDSDFVSIFNNVGWLNYPDGKQTVFWAYFEKKEG